MLNFYTFYQDLKKKYPPAVADKYFDLWIGFWSSCGDSKYHYLSDYYCMIFKTYYYG